jgi:hypothetical protein
MGNNTGYIQPVFFGINVERDFFDHNIFEHENRYNIKYGNDRIFVGREEMRELNGNHTSLTIVEGGMGYMVVKVKPTIETIMKWFTHLILNNLDLKFSTNSEFLKSNLDVFQMRLKKISHDILAKDDDYVIVKI